MKIIPCILTVFWSLTPVLLSAQAKEQPCESCTCILGKARAAGKAKFYENAIKSYNSARNNCPPDSLAAIDEAVVDLFKEINGLLGITEAALTKAKNARNKAEEAKAETQLALNKANRLINAFYFYEDKYALAYGVMFNADENACFYFIDKNGVPALHLLGWERAEQFDTRGFAKVRNDQFDKGYDGNCLLDISGKVYRVAYHEDSLNNDITALDLSGQNLKKIHEKVFEFEKLEVLLLNNNKLDSISV